MRAYPLSSILTSSQKVECDEGDSVKYRIQGVKAKLMVTSSPSFVVVVVVVVVVVRVLKAVRRCQFGG